MAPAPEPTPGHGGWRPEKRGLLEIHPPTARPLHLVAVGVYLALALVLWAHVWFGGSPAHSITCNCGDTAEQVWWFEWLPWAVTHGHNPLLTNALWARLGGVNALSNTSWLAPAALLSPITLLFGPVASFNVANLLAPVLSGWAAFVLAGRATNRMAAQLVAGGLYAFSPFMLRNTVLGHIDLTITAYLPLVLLLGLRLLSREARPGRVGLWLGLLTILQFFTGFEVLALTAVTSGLCALGIFICRPTLVVAAGRQILVALSVAASLSLVVLAYPLWYILDGPRHVVGPFWPVSSSKPWNILAAGPNVFNSHTGLTAVGYLGPQGPNTDFLGFGLLLAVAVSFPLWRRRLSCAILATVGLLSWMLEFFPAKLWARLPMLSSIELVRFALPVSLCVGFLLAGSIDCWWNAAGRRWPAAVAGGRRRTGQVGIVVLVALAFIPLVTTYSIPFRVTTATVPAWFDQVAPDLTAGTAVLTIPFAYSITSEAMAWQAEAHLDFDLVGGFAFVPGGNGVNDEMMSHLPGAVAALRALSNDPLGLTSAERKAIRTVLNRWRPLVVVVVPPFARPGAVAAVTATLGFSPTWSDGVWVWSLPRATGAARYSALASRAV